MFGRKGDPRIRNGPLPLVHDAGVDVLGGRVKLGTVSIERVLDWLFSF